MGHRYSMRVRPYKTDENRVEGVLVVLLDTDVIYKARDDAQRFQVHAGRCGDDPRWRWWWWT